MSVTGSKDLEDKLERANYIIVYIYLAELILKLIGMGIQEYFQSKWNV